VKQGFGKPYQICSKKVVASNKIKFCQTLLQNKTLFAKTKHKLPKDFPKNKTLFQRHKRMRTILKFCVVYCMSMVVLPKHKDILTLGLRDFIDNFNN
jgi:hypothetical protein